MAAPAKLKKIEELLAKVNHALSQAAFFEAERMAFKALSMAQQEQDYQGMARIIAPLWEARRKRLELALKIGRIQVVTGPVTEEMKIKPGCYLVQPPHVGADARRLRLAAFNQEIPVAVLCREPLTRTKLVPIVAISPGSTLRAKTEPPENPDAIDVAWFKDSLEFLGHSAIEELDPAMPPSKRVLLLLDYLDALPEHEALHQELEAACRAAHELHRRSSSVKASKPRKTKMIS